MTNGQDWTEKTYAEAERTLGYTFGDRALLLKAFTHSSFSVISGEENNERLEFLGDAVLELVVTEMLVKRSRENEGKLTELRKQYVSQTALERAEAKIGLMRYLRYSGGESNVGGKTNSNLFEAVVGAIYLDGGLKAASAFISAHLSETETENYKTLLQELTQEREHETPEYRVRERNGRYECTVSALGTSASGQGASKKAAETAAAKALYEKIMKGGSREF